MTDGVAEEYVPRIVDKMVNYTTAQPIRYYPLVGYDTALNSMIRDRDPLVDEGVIIGAAKGLKFDLPNDNWVDAAGYQELGAGQKIFVLLLQNGEPAVLMNSDANPEKHPRQFVVGKVGSQYVLFNKEDVEAHMTPARHAGLEGDNAFQVGALSAEHEVPARPGLLTQPGLDFVPV